MIRPSHTTNLNPEKMPLARLKHYARGFNSRSEFVYLYGSTHIDRPNAFAGIFENPGPTINEEAEWDVCKEDVLRDWIAAHPCSRPFAWWEFFEASSWRRITFRRIDYKYSKTSYYQVFRMESQAHFLKRNNLLTPEEQKYLAAHPEQLATIGPEREHKTDRDAFARAVKHNEYKRLDPSNEADARWIAAHPEHTENLEDEYGQ